MFKWSPSVALSLAYRVGLGPTGASAQEIDIIVALPAQTLTFSGAFIAEDAGFYKKEGLKVSHRFLVGVASPNAVLAGQRRLHHRHRAGVPAGGGAGPAHAGDRQSASTSRWSRWCCARTWRKPAKITADMPIAERAKALRGKTIGIQGVGSIVHAWERLVVNRGGLDVEKDVRIAPMDPPAMLPALENKAIDGYATSLPFTTQAVVKGSAVMLASAATDAPDLLPFAYGLLYTQPDTCAKNREKCVRIVRALAAANRFILEKPDEALELLRKRFDKMDPCRADRRLAGGVEGAREGHQGSRGRPGQFAEGQPGGEAAGAQGRAQEVRRAAHRRVSAVICG